MHSVIVVGVALTALNGSPLQAESNSTLQQDTVATWPLSEEFVPVDTSRFMYDPDPVPLEKVRVFPNLQFTRPIELTYPDDGTNRLFVAEQQGQILLFDNKNETAETTLFLDIKDVVLRKGNEEGLLGLAFHPKYKENGHLFVYYSTAGEKKDSRKSVISRFTVSADNANKVNRDTELKLLEIEQPFSNHNGGSLKFGPDGYLYIGLGDGGKANDPFVNAQNLETLLGSILRIDVDHQDEGLMYAIPADNPFVERENARGEIWAYGVRNIWRLAFDRESGQLYAGDVGQNRFEEVDLIVKGGNYGWNLREATHNFEPQSPETKRDLIDPLAEYFRGEGQSVTGGIVYRGSQLKEFEGAYFYGDYLSGNVWMLRHDGQITTENKRVANTGLSIAAFGEDQQGEMILCTFEGELYRLKQRPAEVFEKANSFPRLLSEAGLFDSVSKNKPVKGLIPYELNMPFWSDYAVKDRYIALPEAGKVVFHEQDKWEFPVGTLFVKTFWMHQDRTTLTGAKRLETRLLVHSPSGWAGYTYVYNAEGTDAELLEGSRLRSLEIKTEEGMVNQPYYFPTRTDCMTCHTKQAGFVLGLNTRQMNHTLDYHDQHVNQLDYLNKLGVFEEKLAKSSDALEAYPEWGFGNLDRSKDVKHEESQLKLPESKVQQYARGWLDVNCAMCHQPDGIAAGGQDLRFHTELKKMNVLNQEPLHGHLTVLGGAVVLPGAPLLSELYSRAGHRGVRQMPPLATNIVDPRGQEMLYRWIMELQKKPAPSQK
ncbi:PQQ-dependent sugar dehydrogenase [Polystyrenella longa]|nr:PQQ-dependent sugar dehydrogenase [Polystyrenella longa]